METFRRTDKCYRVTLITNTNRTYQIDCDADDAKDAKEQIYDLFSRVARADNRAVKLFEGQEIVKISARHIHSRDAFIGSWFEIIN